MKTKNTKLITTLMTVRQKEWKSLKRYLLLYTTKETEYYRLVDLLSRQTPLDSLDIEAFRLKNFEAIASKNFYNMMSKITEWIEDWMVATLINKNQRKKNIYLVKALNNRGLYTQADKKAEKIEKDILEEKQLDLNTNAEYHQLLYYQYYSNNPIKYRDGENLLKKLVSTQMQSYKEYALTYLLELHNRTELSKYQLNDEIEKIRNVCSLIEDNKLIKILSSLEDLVVNKKRDKLKQMTDLLISNVTKNNTDLHLLFYGYIFRISKIVWANNKNAEKSITLDMINYGIESGIYTENGKITDFQFFNLINRLSQMIEYQALLNFIKKWTYVLDKKYADITIKTAYSIAAFHYKQYKKVLRISSNIVHKNIKNKLLISSQKAIALYEENEEGILLSHLHNYKRMKRRKLKPIDEKYYARHKNLIKVIELMVKKKYDESIEIELNDHLPIFYRSWFTDKLLK